MEDLDTPIFVKIVPRLGYDLVALGRLTEAIKPPRRQIREGRQALVYLMSDASGLGFVSVLWGKMRLASDSGDLCPLYQGRLLKIIGGENLTTRIDHSVASE